MDHPYEEGHLHLGYYENGHDLEAIAFKRKGIDTWDVYFDSDIHIPPSIRNKAYTPYFGYQIFVIQSHELTYEDGSRKFEEWLRKYKII